jgi:hypothetical protein
MYKILAFVVIVCVINACAFYIEGFIVSVVCSGAEGMAQLEKDRSVSFLEACAYKCAILSCNNPDEFAENFGHYVRKDDFTTGLKTLLENDAWKQKGEKDTNT